MKVLICEDEAPALKQITRLINNVREDVRIIATAETGDEALKVLEDYDLDLIFMDIELADGPVFKTLGEMEIRIPIIFTTAYDEYALKAFRMNSIDYLLKPISEKDIRRAFKKYNSMKHTFEKMAEDYMDRAEEIIERKGKRMFIERLEDIFDEQLTKHSVLNRLAIKNGGTISLVKTSDVQWIEADGNYIGIQTSHKRYLLRSTLSGLLQKLDQNQFYQIHKSTVLNIEYVNHIEEGDYGDYKVIMKGGQELKMSRNYKELLQSI